MRERLFYIIYIMIKLSKLRYIQMIFNVNDYCKINEKLNTFGGNEKFTPPI